MPKSELSSPRLKRLNDLAIREALRSGAKKKHGAIIFKNKRIISLGFNQLKTHPKCKQEYPYLHAEEDALMRAGEYAKGADLFVVRLTFDGLGMSRPCCVCTKILQEKGIRNIYYSTDDGEIERL